MKSISQHKGFPVMPKWTDVSEDKIGLLTVILRQTLQFFLLKFVTNSEAKETLGNWFNFLPLCDNAEKIFMPKLKCATCQLPKAMDDWNWDCFFDLGAAGHALASLLQIKLALHTLMEVQVWDATTVLGSLQCAIFDKTNFTCDPTLQWPTL